MRFKAMSLCTRMFLVTAVVSAAVLLFPNRAEAASTVAINKTNFPDANFREYVSDNFDTDNNGTLSNTEIKSVTEIDVLEMQIADLKGIEYFTALQYLGCDLNELTTLDLSKNKALETLSCWGNNLTSLDLSNNTKLIELSCSENYLTSLNIKNCTVLEKLYCEHNNLTSLDILSNTELTDLWCYHNQLKNLDLRMNTKLEELICCNNQLTSLDVSQNTELVYLNCSNNKLKTLDVSKNTKLNFLECAYNLLTSLDVSNLEELEYLECNNNYLSALPKGSESMEVSFEPQYEVVSVTTQPKDYTGPVGDTATFKVKASGTALKYQWQTYIDGAWKNSSLTGAKTNTLSVPVTKERNGYKFRCVISDANGYKVNSKTATLNVALEVSITTQPKDYTGTVGSTAKFKVVADGLGIKYQWQTYSNGAWKNSSLTGAKTATLSVPVTQARDGYKFRCVVTDVNGKKATSKTVVLHVTAPVTLAITTQPKSYTGPVGSTATFKVKAQGTGLKYQWQTYKNGKWTNSSLTGATTATLTVPVTKARDGYKFRCVVTDASGNRVASKSVTLKVG